MDIDPGDRAATCGGLMEPVALEGSSPEYSIMHRCTRCGIERRNVASSDDAVEALTAIANKRSRRDT